MLYEPKLAVKQQIFIMLNYNHKFQVRSYTSKSGD